MLCWWRAATGHLSGDVSTALQCACHRGAAGREQGSSGGGTRQGFQFFLDEERALGYAREAVRQALVNLDAIAAPAGACRWCLGRAGEFCTQQSDMVWRAISTAKAPLLSPGGLDSGSRRKPVPSLDDGTLGQERFLQHG